MSISNPHFVNRPKLIAKYVFWQGNIVRTMYSDYRGFWLVKGKNLIRCDQDGKILDPKDFLPGTSEEAVIPIPYDHPSWVDYHWLDKNRGTYPEYDKFNDFEKNQYLNGWTDEKFAEHTVKEREERKKRDEYYESLSPLEKHLHSFDWYYQESDAYNTSRDTAAHVRKFLPDLLALPREEAEAIIKKHNPGNIARGINLDHLIRLESYHRGDK